VYNAYDEIEYVVSSDLEGPASWVVPSTQGQPIAEVGVEADGPRLLDWLGWDGAPDVDLRQVGGSTWRRAWVNGSTQFNEWPSAFTAIQNEGTGLVMIGTREWTNYEVRTDLTLALCDRGGVAACVQGMRRYYALVLCRDNFARLIRVLDGEKILAEAPFTWDFDGTYPLSLRIDDNDLIGRVGDIVLQATDDRLEGGGIALVVTNGRIGTHSIAVGP
jgi:hypothetical protein